MWVGGMCFRPRTDVSCMLHSICVLRDRLLQSGSWLLSGFYSVPF